MIKMYSWSSTPLRILLLAVLALTAYSQIASANTCRAGDLYSEVPLYGDATCNTCVNECTDTCSQKGLRMRKQACTLEQTMSPSVICECCCIGGAPPSPPPSPLTPSLSPPPPSSPSPPSQPICKAGDVYSEIRLLDTSDCHLCEDDCEAECASMGTTLTKQVCEQEEHDSLLCQCCCSGKPQTPPSSTPPTPPSESICKAGDIYSKLRQFGSSDCHLCEDDCQAECVTMGSTLTKQVCQQEADSLLCQCCCAGASSPPSPTSPFLPPPSPSPPTPPSPSPQSICKSGDIYSEVRQLDTNDCQLCEDDCQAECASMGSTSTKQVCVQETESLLCQCCCAGTEPPPSPSQTPPSPSTSPPSPWSSPPTPSPIYPSPPPQPICKAGDAYSELQLFDTSDCHLCLDDCQAECISMGSTLTTQVCEQKTGSLLCKCCCAGTPPSPPSPSTSPPSPQSPPPPSPLHPPPSPQPSPPSPSSTPPPPSPPPPSPICPEPCCPAEFEIPVPGQEPCRYQLVPRAPMPSLPHAPSSYLFATIK